MSIHGVILLLFRALFRWHGLAGMPSPYLLTGLLGCVRCGRTYQRRTALSTKYRTDGTRIQTLYYACGGYVMKGRSACEKFLLRKEPLEELESTPCEPIDTEAVLRHGMAALRDLPGPLEAASPEERRGFVRAFIAGVKVSPDEERLEVQMRKIPASVVPKPGLSSVGLVAGAQDDWAQKNLVALKVSLRGHELVVPRTNYSGGAR